MTTDGANDANLHDTDTGNSCGATTGGLDDASTEDPDAANTADVAASDDSCLNLAVANLPEANLPVADLVEPNTSNLNNATSSDLDDANTGNLSLVNAAGPDSDDVSTLNRVSSFSTRLFRGARRWLAEAIEGYDGN